MFKFFQKVFLILFAFVTFATEPDMSVLIPRTVLFSDPQYLSPELSPDGAKIAYLAPHQKVLNIFVGDTVENARPITNDQNRGIRNFSWAYDNRHVIYIQDQEGDENWRVYVTDIQTQQTRLLTPHDKVQARIVQMSPHFPQEVIIALNDRDPRYHDLWKFNIVTGASSLFFKNLPEFSQFFVDKKFQLRGATKRDKQGNKIEYQAVHSPEEITWQEILKFTSEDEGTSEVLFFATDADQLYLLNSQNRNTAALYQMDLKTKTQTLIAENLQADITHIEKHPSTGAVQAAASTYAQKQWHCLEPDFAADIALLQKHHTGTIEIASRTLDDQKWIIEVMKDTSPVKWYTFDRKTKQTAFLFSARPNLEHYALSKMYPVIIPARDNLELMSYLTIPNDADENQTGIPNKPLPLVLLVHGGPWARSHWGYNATAQWLANRGYAVLDVNFRASSGFGKDFLNKGNNQWGKAMHTDLLDAVNWAVSQKIADPEKIAIFGGSYGGYAVLTGLTKSPDVFTCGVNIVGVSDLEALANEMPPYWEAEREALYKRVYDPRTETGKQELYNNSPIHFIEAIDKPLLIVHGANDSRVKQAQSDRIFNKMLEKNIPVSYLLYPDEGHGVVKPNNRQAMYAAMEGFLARNLGGSQEPMTNEAENSSMIIVKGSTEL